MSDDPVNRPDAASTLREGSRVMVRRRLNDEERGQDAGAHTMTDIVGTLIRRDEDSLVISPRRGRPVSVALADVVTAKPLPPAAGRRAHVHRAISLTALEEIMLDGWAAEQTEWRGRWLLRASGGYTRRANSCLVFGASAPPMPDVLDEVVDWYAQRDLTPTLQVPLPPGVEPASDTLVREAVSAGWRMVAPTLVMTASSGDVIARTGDGAPEDRIDVSAQISSAWWELADERARAHESDAREILTRSPEQLFVTAARDVDPHAHARIALSQGWGGLFDIMTAPAVRRRGMASAVIAACAREASDRGARSLYLQVSADNAGAISLYEKLGFTTHHTYVYVEAPKP